MRIRRGAAAWLIWALVCSPAFAATVIFETPRGDFEVELFEEEAPQTVANFLNYVERGDYNGTFIHRSIPRFVVQGGGFIFEDGVANAIPIDPPVVNEPGISNTRGTIAMAKLAGDPNSATSQWFINHGNNGSTLDDQNGGFTVFGEVVGDGMDVVDALTQIPIWNFGQPFDTIPLIDYPGSGNPVAENFVVINVRVKDEFRINAGLNDAWYNIDTLGQGFFITIYPELGKVFLAWFTFDTVPGSDDIEVILGDKDHRWLTAFGDFEGSRAVLDIELTEGGVFDSATPMTTQTKDGTIILDFSDCENGTVTYDIPSLGLMGVIPIQRIALDNVPYCLELAAGE